MLLTIQRNAATPWGTFGTLRVKDLIICSTLEPEWRDNAPNVSCVPPGHYNLHNRPSSLVERLTLGKHKTAWALASVHRVATSNRANAARSAYLMMAPLADDAAFDGYGRKP